MGDKKLKKETVSSNVDLKDITGVEVRYVHQLSTIIAAFVLLILAAAFFISGALFGIEKPTPYGSEISYNTFCLIFAIPCTVGGLILLAAYFIKRLTLLTIMFGGGGITFDLKWYPAKEAENFQRMLRIAKDKAVEDAEYAASRAVREVMANAAVLQQAPSPADELAKYARLCDDGVISEREFAELKAKLMAQVVTE